MEVLVSPPVERAVLDHLDYTGRTKAQDAVDLRSRVGGYLAEIKFTEGDKVEKGQVLFKIDDRTYEAQRDLARAEFKLVEAQVKEAEAEYQRDAKLRATGSISQEEMEKAQRERDSTRANLDGARATLAEAQLNLDYTEIKAPFSGWADRARVTVGNLVSADTSHATVLTSVVTLDPMYVYFGVDEPTLLRLQNRVREGTLKDDDKKAKVLLGVGPGQDYPFRGEIDYIGNQVDPTTGTLTVRGSFPNKEHFLLPGLFARVRVPIGDPHPVLLVSEACVGTNQGQKYVYVVNDRNEAVYRPVKLGPVSDGLRIVEEGLKAGERVIVGDGVLRVRPGTVVVPQEGKMLPAPSPTGGAPAAGK
jgi:RND family efflux transporter MFP subunit